jgi:hypothetical protein
MENHPSRAYFKTPISNLKSLAEPCFRRLRGWAESSPDPDTRTNYAYPVSCQKWIDPLQVVGFNLRRERIDYESVEIYG